MACFQVQTSVSPERIFPPARLQRGGIDTVFGGDLVEDRSQRTQAGPTMWTRHPADRRASSGGTGGRILVAADVDLDRIHRQAERLRHDDVDDRSVPGAQILGSGERLHRAIGINLDGAGTVAGTSAPGVQAHTETPLPPAVIPLPAGLPLPFPVHQAGGNLHLSGIDLCRSATG